MPFVDFHLQHVPPMQCVLVASQLTAPLKDTSCLSANRPTSFTRLTDCIHLGDFCTNAPSSIQSAHKKAALLEADRYVCVCVFVNNSAPLPLTLNAQWLCFFLLRPWLNDATVSTSEHKQLPVHGYECPANGIERGRAS